MNKPIISVVVPCYNQAEYLPETLQSVCNQSYRNWECILVNDGSPDNTEEVAKEWSKKDVRFRYLKKENGGLSSARNAGIEVAKGEWILPLDSDDIIEPQYMEFAMKAVEENPKLGVVYANARLFGAENREVQHMNYDFKTLLRENLIYCSAFYRREDWARVGGYDTNLKQGWEDWEFWINLLGNIDREVLRLDYLGFNYRIKENSMLKDLVKNKEKEQAIRQYISEKHVDLYLQHIGSFSDLMIQIEALKVKKTLKDEVKNAIRPIVRKIRK